MNTDDTAGTQPRAKFSLGVFLAKILVVGGLASLLFLHMDWSLLGDTAAQLHPATWGGALAAMALQIFLLAWRWTTLCDEKNMTYSISLITTLAALLSNLVLISSVSGTFVRIGLSAQHGISWVKATCAAILDRIMTLLALIILAACFMTGLRHLLDPHIFRVAALTVGVFIAITLVLAPLFFRTRIKKLLSGHNLSAQVSQYAMALLNNPKRVLHVFTSSIAAQTVYFGAVFLIIRGTGADIGLGQVLTVLPVIALVASIPFGFGGWGMREGAFIYGLGLLGVSMETAFLISVQVGLLSMLSVAITALPVLALTPSGRSFMLDRHATIMAAQNAR